MLLVIDNYDSFVHNLARYFALAGWEYEVVRNDEITLDDIAKLQPQALILSPGPCTPKDAGICIEAIHKFGAHIPTLGVCLGHQAIGEAYGATTTRAKTPVHGKSSIINHNGGDLFTNLPSPLEVGRYHSLIVQGIENTPLIPTATLGDEIMALRHETHPVYGVQFHPESVMTQHGQALIQNFTDIAHRWHQQKKNAA